MSDPAAGAIHEPAGYPVYGQNATSQQFGHDTETPPLPERPTNIDEIVDILVANGLCK